MFLPPRKDSQGVTINENENTKKWRNWVYRICGTAIVLCMVGVAIEWGTDGGVSDALNLSTVFWLESIGLVAFGIAWLTHSRWFFFAPFADSDDPALWGPAAKSTG